VRGGDNGTSAAASILHAMGIDAPPVVVGYGAGSASNIFVHTAPTVTSQSPRESGRSAAMHNWKMGRP
jgi:hypothetical protein